MATYREVALIPIGEVDPAPLSWLKEDPPGILQATVEEFPSLPLALRHFRKDRDQ